MDPGSGSELMNIRRPTYGRTLEDFEEGAVFVHPRGFTVFDAFAQEFATTFHETCPLYLNRVYAREHGYRDMVASPLLVLNLALSMGVQNDSEKAIAHLGYYDVRFLRPVYPGDTLRSMTKVLGRRERGPGEPGIAHVRTVALNERAEPVLRYDRKIMVPSGGAKAAPAAAPDAAAAARAFPETDGLEPAIPAPPRAYPRDLTGPATYAEDFAPGDVIVHANGRTVTDEHFAWTYRLMNTHPLHYDRLYSQGREGKMSGEPIVYGGLAFAWVCGLASRDVTENALYDLSFDEGYHTQPLTAGETITALTRVDGVEDHPGPAPAAVLKLRHVGFKDARPEAVLEKHGEDVFIRENDKKKLGKEKIPEKIFEIDRRVLVKKRP
jgi:2-methylfumaryl-CoA hydratase